MFNKSKKTKKRTKEEMQEEILNVLRLSPRPLTTKKISNKINLNFNGTKKHLKYLEFCNDVESFKFGSVWTRWKIKGW